MINPVTILLMLTFIMGVSCPTRDTYQPLRKCLAIVQPFFLDLDALKELDNSQVITLLQKHKLQMPEFTYVEESDEFVEIALATEEDVITSGFLISTEDFVEVAVCMREYEAAVPGSIDQ